MLKFVSALVRRRRKNIALQLLKLTQVMPTTRVLVVRLCLVTLIATAINGILFHNNPRSPFNFWAESQRKAFHDDMLAKAARFMENPTMPPIGDGVPDLALSVMTTKRALPYVHVWYWSLMTGNSAEELSRTRIIFNNIQYPSSANTDLAPFRDQPSITIHDAHPDLRSSSPATPRFRSRSRLLNCNGRSLRWTRISSLSICALRRTVPGASYSKTMPFFQGLSSPKFGA